MGKAKKKQRLVRRKNNKPKGSQNSVRLINYFGIGNVGCILLFG